MTMFVEWERGPDAAISMLESNVAARYLTLLRTSADQIADLPWADGGPNFADVVYGKAALGFLAIRLEIGSDAFSAAIRALATPGDGFAFKIATPQDFLAAFEAASGSELDPLWNSWFLSATATADEVVTLVEQYRATVGEPIAA
jgi:aminopeptidase N